MEHRSSKPTPADLAALEKALELARSQVARTSEMSPRDFHIDPAEIRAALRGRRLRDDFFGKGLFEEPAWDMILDLFAAELEGRTISTSSLCIAASVAPTTALRWITKLTDLGILIRRADHLDRRRTYLELSERGRIAIYGYVEAMRRTGLSFA